MHTPASQRRFVPEDFVPSSFEPVLPLLQALLDRPIGCAGDLLRWLLDVSELHAVIDEYGSRCYIAKSCHTDDPAIEQRYLNYIERIEPRVKPLMFALQRKYLDCPFLPALDRKHQLLARHFRADVEIFREENVPLQTQAAKLVNEYDKLCGAMVVEFQGQTRTLQQMGRFQEETHRPTREQAWRLVAERRLRDRQTIDKLFDQLLELRHRIAVNAGLDNYRDYVWKQTKRFDYTPDHCARFADAVANTVVPLAERIARRRKAQMGVDSLRPWDTAVDPLGLPPLRPFEEKDIAGFVNTTRRVIDRLSPELGAQFASLAENNNLDLDSRPGKQPGGYQCALEESRQPFIFMNAVGLQGDVETLLHEAGHAFHYLAARDEPVAFLRHSPLEFAEVASMTMELLGMDHLDAFYPDPQALARARRNQMEDVVSVLAWIATIDSFQHWLYTSPGHTTEERAQAWLRILGRFSSPTVDWSGLEEPRRWMWQRQLHLFHHPFYYIEYGIAQLGALQIWLKSRQDPRQAMASYRNALKLGGTRPLPELYEAAGAQLEFSEKTLRPLMSAVEQELELD